MCLNDQNNNKENRIEMKIESVLHKFPVQNVDVTNTLFNFIQFGRYTLSYSYDTRT